MERACYGPKGPLVTVSEFLGLAGRNYKNKGVFPHCPACQEILEIYGAHSVAVTPRFDHQNLPPNSDPFSDCILANRGDGRFKDLEPNGWDYEQGKILREDFFRDDSLRRAYSFSLHMCGVKNLSANQFGQLIERADRRNVWSYRGITPWVIPYILITLGDFRGVSSVSQKVFDFHFVFEKPKKSPADVLWLSPEECSIIKLFSRTNKPFDTADNPYPLSEQLYNEKAGDSSWVSGSLLRALKAFA